MLDFMEGKHKDLLAEIKEKKEISDELGKKLSQVLEGFKEEFQI
jgi:F0F1-type ATP synthase alpha subunit